MNAHGINCGACLVRPWRAADLPSLVQNINNKNIWLNLRDRLPFPYTEADGQAWLDLAAAQDPITNFAIDYSGNAIGGIGLILKDDVERGTAEIGYWLGKACWGRGLGTQVVGAFTEWAFQEFNLRRIFALPFAANGASRRVLEKSGYRLEGILRQHIIKDGQIQDQAIYAKLRM